MQTTQNKTTAKTIAQTLQNLLATLQTSTTQCTVKIVSANAVKLTVTTVSVPPISCVTAQKNAYNAICNAVKQLPNAQLLNTQKTHNCVYAKQVHTYLVVFNTVAPATLQTTLTQKSKNVFATHCNSATYALTHTQIHNALRCANSSISQNLYSIVYANTTIFVLYVLNNTPMQSALAALQQTLIANNIAATVTQQQRCFVVRVARVLEE